MKFNLLKIHIRHIFVISLLLLILETAISAVYDYATIRSNSFRTAETLVHYLVRARLTVLYSSDRPPAVFQKQLSLLQSDFANTPRIGIYVHPRALPNTLLLPENALIPDSKTLKKLIQTLSQNHELLLSTYLAHQNVWVTFEAHYSNIVYWEQAAIFLFYNLLVIVVLWLGFFLYCRYTLPSQLFRGITNREPDPPGSIIQNLQKQIQDYLDEKNLMLGALAHDIKTPLTEALLRVELLSDQTVASAIKNSLNKINQIVCSSLEYAKQSHRIKTTLVDIISLIELLVEDYASETFSASLDSDVDACDILVEVELFKRMVINLLENAKRYAAHCQITLRTTDQQVTLIFEDNGPGVPEKFLKLLGVPYFRIDQSRSSQTGGSGLGLAIVKKIVELHHGRIQFHNLPQRGLQAVIELPLNMGDTSE